MKLNTKKGKFVESSTGLLSVKKYIQKSADELHGPASSLGLQVTFIAITFYVLWSQREKNARLAILSELSWLKKNWNRWCLPLWLSDLKAASNRDCSRRKGGAIKHIESTAACLAGIGASAARRTFCWRGCKLSSWPLKGHLKLFIGIFFPQKRKLECNPSKNSGPFLREFYMPEAPREWWLLASCSGGDHKNEIFFRPHSSINHPPIHCVSGGNKKTTSLTGVDNIFIF